jgi:predicted nucleic acid-binding protein
MSAVVVDASVAVKWFVPEPDSDLAVELLRSRVARIGPDLLFVEVGTALSRRVRLGEMTPKQAYDSLRRLPRNVPNVVGSPSAIRDAMTLSLSLRHPLPDCLYLSLAKQVDFPLITADAAFASKVATTADANRVIELAYWKRP